MATLCFTVWMSAVCLCDTLTQSVFLGLRLQTDRYTDRQTDVSEIITYLHTRMVTRKSCWKSKEVYITHNIGCHWQVESTLVLMRGGEGYPNPGQGRGVTSVLAGGKGIPVPRKELGSEARIAILQYDHIAYCLSVNLMFVWFGNQGAINLIFH